MKDKIFLITGATGEVGREIVRYLYRQGARVVLVARDLSKLEMLANELGERGYCIPFDLTDTERIEQIFVQCKEKNLKLDGMVHLAGSHVVSPIRVKDYDLWDQLIALNTMSFVELVRCFANKKYSKDESSVVAFSSIATMRNMKGQVAYNATKTMMNSFIRSASREIPPNRVRINGILPAEIETGNKDAWNALIENYDDVIKGEQPLGRIPTMQIAYLAEFLLSSKSKYITGALIPVEAGTVTY